MRPEHWLFTIPLRLRSLFRRRETDLELDDELRDHVERKTEEYLSKGLAVEEARRQALVEMGGIEKRKEECRDTRRVNWIQDLIQDLRYGVRTLQKSPGFAIAAVLILALGIGANTAIFSVVSAVLLHPLPFPQSDRLVSVRDFDTASGLPHSVASYPDFVDWRAQNRVFSSMTAYHDSDYTLTDTDEAAHLAGEVVTSGFLTTLGVRPEFGRGFLPDDEKPGHYVVILSNHLWQSTFGADPTIVGRTVELNNEAYLVAGVMPPDFTFPITFPRIQLWTSCSDDAGGPAPATAARDSRFLHVMARLKSGVTIKQAQANMARINSNLAREYPDADAPYTSAYLQPELQHLVGDTAEPLLVLLGAVSCLLLIACANVAGLLLAKAMGRQREVAIRVSLGASRGRIIRQLLTESVLLAFLGGLLGLAVAFGGIIGMVRLIPEQVPRISQAQMDGRVLLFVLLVSVATGILFGLVPAVRSSKTGLVEFLKEGGQTLSRGKRHAKLRQALVVAQMALALALLTGAALMIQSFARLETLSPGFNPDHVLTFNFDLPDNHYSPARKVFFYRQLLGRVSTLPGVVSAAGSFPLPMSGNSVSPAFSIQGHPVAKGNEPHANLWVVTHNFFDVMKIPLIEGREFNETDGADAPKVVIINQAFARRFFPNQDPVGGFIIPDIRRKIVGVVGDVRTRLSEPAAPQYYLPYAQSPMAVPLTVAARTVTDPESLVMPVRQTLNSLDRNVPMYGVQTMDQYIAEWAAPQGVVAALLSAFAGLALALTACALYGVISYSVGQRTHEIGVRMALGAHPRDVLWMVIREGLLLAGIGVIGGMAGAFALTRFLRNLLFEIQPTDLVTFVAVAILLTVVAALACYIPARQAMRVDPMVALRYE